MTRKYEATEHLKEGLTLQEIARRMEISVASVSGYLYSVAGEGRIRRSDIVFAIPKDIRQAIEGCLSQSPRPDVRRMEKALNKGGVHIDRAEIETYLNLRDSRVSRGDMYEFVCDIEQILHEGIRRILLQEYGDQWWLDGIPESIRKECASRREVDRHQAKDSYRYTMFIDLKEILDKNWKLFGKVIPVELASDKPELMRTLQTTSAIRNRVMHPIKGLEFTEDEFAAVRRFRQQLFPRFWRFPKATSEPQR